MRIWDLAPALLCRNHLLGEHRELHALWVVISEGRTGYSRHPETVRWKGKLRALFGRHEMLVREMERRGYVHASPLDRRFATGSDRQRTYVTRPREQLRILRRKGCGCRTNASGPTCPLPSSPARPSWERARSGRRSPRP